MKVVFLCGGTGKRMFPITEDKFLLDFKGKTLLERQVEMARHEGLKEFVIIGNPGNIERIKAVAASTKDVKLEFAVQVEPLGIADALKSAAGILSGEILVVNPNDVFDRSAYEILLGAYKAGGGSSYMLGYRVKEYFPGGYLAVGEQGELTGIVEKPAPGSEPSDLVNILLHLHTDAGQLFEYIDRVQTTRDDVYECALDGMAKDKHSIKVARYDGFWSPIKYPWHIFDVVRRLLSAGTASRPRSASISDTAVISGRVMLGDNVRILEHAVIKGPVYIGADTVIGNNALVREYSHIGARCVVGFSTEIKGSYIGSGCWFHSSYIGDSIIGNNCSFGAGSVTANFRFDEKPVHVTIDGSPVSTGRDHFGAIIGDGCKVGINAGILPGRRVGPGSIVGSHVCLAEDLKPGMTITCRQPHEITGRDPGLTSGGEANAADKSGS